ncbi:sensor histidine kinase [Ruegeria hyattellae]|uniref:sensor histidine kinase n=1 Tax=Ruegeria hyattellae TaxID=3233337 RepID=UPI00355BD0D1
MRRLSVLIFVIATLLAAVGVFQLSYSYFRAEELSRAEGRLSLYRSSVTAELARFSHLTHVLARDTYVVDTAAGASTGALNQRLEGFADQAGLDAIYLMGPEGLTVAASNFRASSSFVGQSYAFRPYFRQALEGRQGRFYGIGTTTGLPGYFIADAVRNSAGQVDGVIAIKIDFTQLEDSWRNAGEQVFLANEDGVILLASDPDWRYRVLKALSADQRARIEAARQFPGQKLAVLDWSDLPNQRARLTGAERLHLTSADLPHGWELHYFTSDDRAVDRAWLVSVSVVLLAGLGFILLQVQRARRMGAALRRSEEEEVQLRQANERLAVEISERRTAERQLQRTQNELERASRLAALGQLAASVTHELGQPIAAMRNHLAAAEMAMRESPGLTNKIGALVQRMEGITRQLKFFARSDVEEFTELDLRDAMEAALALVSPNVAEIGATLQISLSEAPVILRGSKLRIEQVMTNLLRNALDAVEEAETPTVSVRLGASDSENWFEIRDNGHGLGAATLAELQEPFVTTRESGRGMGLGLAISASIVKDHGGVMTARNARTVGAVFRVSFPKVEAEESGTA